MSKKQDIQPPINPGISLLIVVFIVLCLFTFSAITLASALNEHNRSDILSKNTSEYYDASNRAEQAVLMVREALIEAGEWTLDKPIDLSYDINQSQALEVRLEPLAEPEKDKYFNITKWQVVQTSVWEGDDTLNLFVPE